MHKTHENTDHAINAADYPLIRQWGARARARQNERAQRIAEVAHLPRGGFLMGDGVRFDDRGMWNDDGPRPSLSLLDDARAYADAVSIYGTRDLEVLPTLEIVKRRRSAFEEVSPGLKIRRKPRGRVTIKR